MSWEEVRHVQPRWYIDVLMKGLAREFEADGEAAPKGNTFDSPPAALKDLK